jgi:hypothetical protein
LIKEETLYVHLQKRQMTLETNDLNSYLIIPNSFIKHISIDKKYFDTVVKNSKLLETDYARVMKDKFEKDRVKRNKKLCWWILRAIRLRIKLFGGVDLNGNK